MSVDPPFDGCPTCSGDRLVAEVYQQALVVFRCLDCGVRWQFELGHVRCIRSDAP